MKGTARHTETRSWKRSVLFLPLCLLPIAAVLAFSAPPDSSRTSTTFTPDLSVSAGGSHRLLFGDLWRDVWTLPVTVPVIRAFPLQHPPADETLAVIRGMRGYQLDDRSRIVFTPLVKPVEAGFNREFQRLYAPGVLADLRAMAHPYARLLAGPFMDAAGVLHLHSRFVVLQEEGQGGAGGGAGEGGFVAALPSTPLIDSYELLRRLERGGAGQVDPAAFLAARLLGLYLGDWEEGLDAWAWTSAGDGRSVPVLLDPSHAFTRFDGIIPRAGTFFLTSVDSWDGGLPSVGRVLWTGRHLDRWLLSPLEKRSWDSVTAVTASRLTDSVIEASIRVLPEEVRIRYGTTLAADMKSRRDRFPQMADEFYRMNVRVVDLHGTDGPELAEITRIDDERVRVCIRAASARENDDPTVLSDRVFTSAETDEIRILLKGGDDRIVVRGHVASSIPVRVAGGQGNDEITDSSSVSGYLFGIIPFIGDAENCTYVYDGPGTVVHESDGTVFRTVDPAPPANDTVRFAPEREDRGYAQTWTGMFDWNSEFGPMIGVGPTLTYFDHDTRPFISQMSLLGGIAPFAGVGRLVMQAEWRGLIRNTAFLFDATATGFEVLTYFGRGNESVTSRSPNDPYYRVRQTQVRLEPALRWPADGPLTLTVQSGFRIVITGKGEHKYVTDEKPYGIADMALASFSGSMRWDTRDDDVHPFSGAYCDISGMFVPKAFSVGAPYGRLRGDARFFVTTGGPAPVTLSLRVLGVRSWGKVPYYDAATIGSSTAMRGYQQGRFAGASSLAGIVETRVRLGRIDIITPVMYGVFGFAETGRVFEPGEESGVWHPSFGGGVWAAPWRRDATLTASIGVSKESVMLYGAVGFGF